ncbi:MAG: selenium-dependent xanthine dehydrogenase [Spirochaetia bacterium]|nr:selenium-dependent xanthine dehydrogenase [Spirochaetia bacterium]
MAYTFSVNGSEIFTNQDKSLLRFLRENLNLYGAKDGCSEGACGTCTVIVDGKARKACTIRTSRLEGRHVTTIEGLSEREQEVYSYCFAVDGAVQCGFCIPGMVMAAKALLDENDNPTLQQVKDAIRGNICRCTGYVKIEKAILDCARFFRENLPIPENNELPRLDMRYTRPDAVAKALGKGIYTDDINLEGMLHCRVLRAAYPRARVVRLDISKAMAHPDCVYVATADDVPENILGHLVLDWDVMIHVGDITRYIGDAIAIVASTNIDSLDQILGLIEVEYEVLEPMTTVEEALKEGSPKIHKGGNILDVEHIIRGNADKAIAESAHVVTRTYHTPYTEHAFMEVECAVAKPEGNDGVLVYTSSQSIYDEQREISRMLKIPKEKVHCHSMLVGGGFGGKEDMSVQHHAALMAWLTKKPCKLHLTRQESLMVHPKRHPMDITITTACDEKGYITGMKAVILSNTGAYASLGGPVLQRACTHASGPYNYQNIDILGKAIYTNNVPAGAFRGFGVTQSCFAVESNLNLLAEEVGMDPFDFKYMNALRPGDVMPNGQVAGPDCGIRECMDAVRDAYKASPYTGLAISFKNTGLGVGVPDSGRCILSIEHGVVHVRTSAACMGQGIATMCTQMLGQSCGLTSEQIFVEPPDTTRTPDSGCSTASRQTAFTGEAVKRAAAKLNAELTQGKKLSDLEGKEFSGEFTFLSDPITSTKDHPVSHLAYSYASEVVELDADGKLQKVTYACDIGTVVNITAAEGQVEGGVAMGLGYGLTEDFPTEGGYLKVKYGTLGLLRSTQMPEQIDVKFVHGPGKSPYAYGAKGIGELSAIPGAPACQHAYYRKDHVFRTELPLKDTFYKKNKKK